MEGAFSNLGKHESNSFWRMPEIAGVMIDAWLLSLLLSQVLLLSFACLILTGIDVSNDNQTDMNLFLSHFEVFLKY